MYRMTRDTLYAEYLLNFINFLKYDGNSFHHSLEEFHEIRQVDSPAILCRINPIPRIDTYLFKDLSNIVLPSTHRPPQWSFPVGLPVKILKALLLSSILATCPTHLNLLDSIILTILGERYKL